MEDEPFDAQPFDAPAMASGNGQPQLRKSTPSVPPAAAFGKSGAAPPPAAFGKSPAPPAPPMESVKLPDSFNQYEKSMDAHRSESALETNRSLNTPAEREATRRFLSEETNKEAPVSETNASETTQPNYSNYKLSSSVATDSTTGGLAPRQPYSFKKSSSYDTNELIRKYGAMSGVPPSVSSSGTSFTNRSTAAVPEETTPKVEKPGDVREEAMKVLNLVDDLYSQPFDIRRTQSGGFRATPHMNNNPEDPYQMRRTSSGNNTGGKRVPSALSGLEFTPDARTSWKAGRYSFADASFREDDHISVEDDLMNPGEFEDTPVIDVVTLGNRAMSSRAASDDQEFDGDFPETPSSWSARYSDTFTSQKRILDQWDREYDNERRTNARNMFMTTANSVRSAAGSAWVEAQNQGEKVFGPGFSFRKNHVFGKQGVAEVNLRPYNDDNITGPRVHKSWQEVMLNKKKRRRVLILLGLIVAAGFAVIGVTTAGNNQGGDAIKATADGLGSSVSFYVTSDVPYNKGEQAKLNKDLAAIPGDAEFVVHLGNIQKASETFCPWDRYQNIGSVLQDSPVPLFMVPGAEDWVHCPNPSQALSSWKDAFVEFDANFVHGFQVFRDRVHPEAFAFLHNGVLFLGLHIVNGPVHDPAEWDARGIQMLTFYFGMTNLHKDEFRAIVILGNARPSPQQQEFFTTIFQSLRDIQRPMAYIHANSGDGTIREYNPEVGNPSVVGVEIEDGGKNPPLKITVGFGDLPFLVG